jgi:hypothetical protein
LLLLIVVFEGRENRFDVCFIEHVFVEPHLLLLLLLLLQVAVLG